jgi:hypothetical protein
MRHKFVITVDEMNVCVSFSHEVGVRMTERRTFFHFFVISEVNKFASSIDISFPFNLSFHFIQTSKLLRSSNYFTKMPFIIIDDVRIPIEFEFITPYNIARYG